MNVNNKNTTTPNKKRYSPNQKKSRDSNFKDYCLRSGDITISQGSPYRWSNNHWRLLCNENTPIGLERMALDYLETHYPDKANTASTLSAARYALMTLPQLPAKPTDHIIPLQDAWLRISKNGVIEVLQPNKASGITYVIKASINQSQGTYRPQSLPAHSLFRRFLETSLPDAEVRDLVQEFCGYTLLNGVQMQKAQIWQGQGANGKSVLLKIISELHEKRAAIRLDKLEGFALTQLVGASLAISSETPRGSINEEMLKAVITGDPITVEPKYKPEFTHSPSAKWIIACNEFPRIGDKSDGIWRRFQVIDWSVQIPEKKRVHDLDSQIIKNELKLVLDWCLEGVQRLIMRGEFQEPAVVKQASLMKRNENSNVAMFAEESNLTLATGNEYLIKDELYTKYREYCQGSGYTPHNKDNFFKQLYGLFKGINKELKKSVKGKWLRVVPLHFKEDAAPLNAEEEQQEQLQLDKDLISIGW